MLMTKNRHWLTVKNTKELSGQREKPVNGYEIPEDSPFVDTLIATRKESTDREATRYLCAATQVSIEYAERVISRVMNEPFRALAPTFGVDVGAVAKWAIKAIYTRAHRNQILAAIFMLVILVSALSFVWAPGLILLPIILLSSWLTVSWEHWERIHNVVTQKMLRNRFDPEQAPSPRREVDRTRLDEIAKRKEGNLVVFSGHTAFIGSGRRLRYKRILLDVSRGREADDGTPTDPDNFTSQDLHIAVARAFDNESGLARCLADVRVYERLFVNGLHIQYHGQLLPDPLRPPPTSIDPQLLRTAALHPTPEARTYVCVEMPGWQGQLVVTLFIRAVHTGHSLYIDWTFQVLPPLRAKFLEIDQLYEVSRHSQVAASLIFGLRKTVPALLKSPYEVLKDWRRPRITRRDRYRQAHAIASGYVFDYGAQRSIREDACGTQRRHYFLARDETMYMLLAEQTLTRAIENFLKGHNVDLGQFKDQVKVIFDNSITVGDISGSRGVTIGDNSSSSANGSSGGGNE
jgi:hypothetical protein